MVEKTRRLKVFSIVALIVAVLGLTIAFAALSKTLTINGTGSVDAANWDIHFKNISEPVLTGKATTTGTPSLADNGATINDMKVSLKEPGDKVVYTVDIENSGDINAEIDSITLPEFTTAQSNILDFKAVYTSNNKEIAQEDILESKETKNVTITIMYKDITDESLLPKEGISVNLKYELHFVQTDKASGSSSQGGSNPIGSCAPLEKKDTYQVGDVIALDRSGNKATCSEPFKEYDTFYVIEDNNDVLTLYAADVLTDDGTFLEADLAVAQAWDWTFDETLETYKNIIKNEYNYNIIGIDLMTVEQALNLGCTDVSCSGANWVTSTLEPMEDEYGYWLDYYEEEGMFAFLTRDKIILTDDLNEYEYLNYIRPVITISKSEL